MTKATSTLLSHRIHSLDLLRGFALLGILIMNIISFSHIGAGYINPTVGAGIEGYNGIIHGFSYMFADMRFMGLFSLLFGAGLILFTDNLKKKGLSQAKYHYRRMFFLFLFGLIHAYLIWMGDILVTYAICGCVVFLMRNWKTRTMIIVGTIFFMVPILFHLTTYFFTPPDILRDIFSWWTPEQADIDEEIAAYRGTYMDQMEPRASAALEFQTFMLLIDFFWRVCAMMLTGAILYRKGILSGERSNDYYNKMMLLGFGIGISLSAYGLYQSHASNWDGVWVMNIGITYNTIASFFMVLGYIGLIIRLSKSTFLTGLQTRLQAVGRMAFTNYIGMSVVCTLIYYGHGFGLFATMDRLQTSIVVIVIWALMLLVSPVVLGKYKQGPLEYLWRRLTYGKSRT